MNTISEQTLREKVSKVLERIPPETFWYDEEDAKVYEEDYRFVKQYAVRHGLYNTLIALPVVRGLMSQGSKKNPVLFNGGLDKHLSFYQHGLIICRTLIDLNLPLTKEETDICFAAAICHVLPEMIVFENLERDMREIYQLDPKVYEIVSLITRVEAFEDDKLRSFYQKMQENKLAVLIRIADRSHIVEQLYALTSFLARAYIYETREYFFPLCIYAKEHYPELTGQISVLMEKLRSLIDAGEILLERFEQREKMLSRQVLIYREENSRIRGIIEKLKEEQIGAQ